MLCPGPPHNRALPPAPLQLAVYEEINANVLVVGDYKAYNKDNPSAAVNVDVLVRQRLWVQAAAGRARLPRAPAWIHPGPPGTLHRLAHGPRP
jgi:hypothetical protein